MTSENTQTQGIDLGEFLEFYLLDSYEQVERLGAGLLQLEKEGDNIALINELFRSAHSLKGASGTMGFTPIVELTHAAEDLLDRVRQGKITVSFVMIDVLLAVTDRVKEMLDQVKAGTNISIAHQDLAQTIRGFLTEDEGALNALRAKPDRVAEARNLEQHDFGLGTAERTEISEAQSMGHGVYQIRVRFSPNTLMRAVRAMMVVQRIESCGKLVKLSPGIEELEMGDYEQFFALVISDENVEEIRVDILGVSELAEVDISPYQVFEGYEVDNISPSRVVVAVGGAALETTVKANVSGQENKQSPTSNNEGSSPAHTIRVDTNRLDNLINLVGEMVITRTRLVQIGTDLKTQYRADPLVGNLNETNGYFGRLMNDLQESVMRLRMVPIGTVFSRFPRLVRDLARKTGKEIDLELRGEETELDKTVVEAIGDPLMHLIRNSVDHGIEGPVVRKERGKAETGQIVLDAYHEGNHIIIQVSDDGAGLDLAKIKQKALAKGLIGEKEELSEREVANLIFLPGFSTAEQVTDISGRGVGMDVVKRALSNLGGTIDIDTRSGQGTTFTIRLPLTLAIIQALLVEVGQDVYAIPLSSVSETLMIKRSDIKTVGARPMVQLRGNTLPLISLQEKFGLPEPATYSDEVFVVVVGLGEKNLGLIVDGLRGQQEIVIKSLGDLLGSVPGIAGATILGDGKVTLILDVGSLIQDIVVLRQS